MINTHLGEVMTAVYPDDFPMLSNGREFAMKKQGNNFIIQTIIYDDKKLAKLIRDGEKELNERIERGRKRAIQLMDSNSYTFDDLSEDKKREEAFELFYGVELFQKLKIHKAI